MSIAQISSPATVWDRVVCAVDRAPSSVHAARAAARLMPPAASLTLCRVVDPHEAGPLDDLARTRDAKDALDRAQAQIQPERDAELHLREGPPISRLLDELATERATLVAVGSPAHGQAGLGSVATAMLHDAPCSVLIAHAEDAGDGEVVVGFDGSGGARRALAVGRELSARLSLTLRVIVATGDARAPGPGWSREELGTGLAVIEDPRTAVEVLTDASPTARLLILGSRHLPAALALSSVSEQAAQRARSAARVSLAV
jgi:nucleotide-binding universal stress UspA family protein